MRHCRHFLSRVVYSIPFYLVIYYNKNFRHGILLEKACYQLSAKNERTERDKLHQRQSSLVCRLSTAHHIHFL